MLPLPLSTGWKGRKEHLEPACSSGPITDPALRPTGVWQEQDRVMERSGYSAVEITAVLVFLGIAAATAIPEFAAVFTRFAVRNAADEFVSSFQLARAAALRSGGVASLHIDDEVGRFWVEVDTTAARTGVTDTIGPVRYLFRHGVEMESSREEICFDSRGFSTPVPGCPPSDGLIVFSRGDHADTVRTTLTGKVLR